VVAVSKSSNYTILPADSGTYFDNGGAFGPVVFALPPLAAGLNFRFTVVTGQTIEVLAPFGVKIALGVANSSSGGNISSDLSFSSVFVYAPSGVSGQWIAISETGGWDVA
jgi:hypothetical protein